MQPQAETAVQKGGPDSLSCPGANHTGLTLQGLKGIPEPVKTVRPAPPGDCCGSLVTMDLGGSGDPGESPEASWEGCVGPGEPVLQGQASGA